MAFHDCNYGYAFSPKDITVVSSSWNMHLSQIGKYPDSEVVLCTPLSDDTGYIERIIGKRDGGNGIILITTETGEKPLSVLKRKYPELRTAFVDRIGFVKACISPHTVWLSEIPISTYGCGLSIGIHDKKAYTTYRNDIILAVKSYKDRVKE